MKLIPLSNRLSKALKHPKPAIDYVFRVWKLSNFLPEYKHGSKEFFKEASDVRDEVEAFLEVRLLAPSVIYSIVRAVKPEIVIETGVSNGVTTYFIISALERNGCGMLYSIDIEKTIRDGKKIGWLVPEELRNRWNILLGDGKDVLLRILSEVEAVDIFLHDGAHTYEYMSFEFRTAWRYLHDGGVLLSDDIYI